MIQDLQQLVVSRRRLHQLEARLRRLRMEHQDPLDLEFYSEQTSTHAQRIRREIRDFLDSTQIQLAELAQLWGNRGSLHPSQESDVSLGEFLALARIANGLTQRQLADLVGCNQSHIARYERRDYSGYTVETIDRLLDALGITLQFQPTHRTQAA